MEKLMQSSRYSFLSVLILMLVALGSSAYAQGRSWGYVGDPEGGLIVSLARDADGNVFAGTDVNGLFRSTDDGATWSHADAGIREKRVDAICAVAGHLFAITGPSDVAGILYRSDDDGLSWRQLSLSPSIGSPLTVDSSGALLSSGSRGTVRSTDAGESWTMIDSVESEMTRGLAAGPGGVDYAISAKVYSLDIATIRRTTDGGRTWSRPDNSFENYTCIAVASNGTVYAGTKSQGLLRSTDSGATWYYANDGDTLNRWIRSITILPGNVIIAVSQVGLLRSTDEGVSWAAASRTGILPMVAIGGNGPELLIGSDKGMRRGIFEHGAWSPINQGLTATALQALAVGRDGQMLAAAGNELYLSADGGRSWSDLDWAWPDGTVPPLATADGSFLVELRNGDRASILRITDAGARWSTVAQEVTTRFSRFALAPDGRIYAGTYGDGLFRSTDDGVTWSRFGPAANGLTVSAIAFDASGKIMVGTGEEGMGTLYAIGRESGEWSRMSSIDNAVGVIDVLATPRSLVALTLSPPFHSIFRSGDGGGVWSATMKTDAPSAIAVDHDGTIYAGSRWNGVHSSTDDGATWSIDTAGLSALGVQTLAVDASGRVYAGTQQGLFATIVPAGVDRAANDDAGESYRLAIYPNPASGSCSVSYHTAATGVARLSLIDALGREVMRREDLLEAGEHHRSLDLSTLPDGRYLLRVEAGGVTRAMPLVLIRGVAR
jgi:photosystem II stability/assembly factor-like uncharacterized protein